MFILFFNLDMNISLSFLYTYIINNIILYYNDYNNSFIIYYIILTIYTIY
jgi:hypothetical protein